MKDLLLGELNKDQLSGLAELSFSLSKVVYALAIVPIENPSDDMILHISSKIATVIMALAVTMLALLFLKMKERVKR